MRSIKNILFIILLFVFSFSIAYAKEKVLFSKCVDGDTIKVLINNEEKTIRMLAVDTPETVHPTKGIEYYGKEASKYTCDIVTNALKIELEYDNTSDKEDKYNRLLAWVWVDDILLQDELIKNGYAEVAYLYGNYKYTDLLQDHERIAEASKIGIWNEEARKEFDTKEVSDNNSNNGKDNGLSFEYMSIKEVIIFISLVLLLSLITPIIKKCKRKIKNIIK